MPTAVLEVLPIPATPDAIHTMLALVPDLTIAARKAAISAEAAGRAAMAEWAQSQQPYKIPHPQWGFPIDVRPAYKPAPAGITNSYARAMLTSERPDRAKPWQTMPPGPGLLPAWLTWIDWHYVTQTANPQRHRHDGLAEELAEDMRHPTVVRVAWDLRMGEDRLANLPVWPCRRGEYGPWQPLPTPRQPPETDPDPAGLIDPIGSWLRAEWQAEAWAAIRHGPTTPETEQRLAELLWSDITPEAARTPARRWAQVRDALAPAATQSASSWAAGINWLAGQAAQESPAPSITERALSWF